ncbi:MAG TPA: glycoside hydrolase family 18 protein [Chitinophaga sp.]
MFKKLIPLCALAVLCISLAPPAKKHKKVIIGYVGGYKGLTNTYDIAAEKLTHINYAFVNVQHNRAVLGNEATDTVNFRNLNALKQKNPDLKIMISIGGWAWSENFSDAVLTDTSRAAFAASAVEIVRKYQLDGVDIDWEYPAIPGEEGNVFRPEDTQNYTLMFQALRLQLDTLEKAVGKHLFLTCAVGGSKNFVDHTEMGKAAPYLDYVNLMTYDNYGGAVAGHHTSLYASRIYNAHGSADSTVQWFHAAGVPYSKLVMGIAFYGRGAIVADTGKRGLGDAVVKSTRGGGYTFLKDSLVNKKGFREFHDETAKASYLFNPDTHVFITYDDEWSVKNKCTYVLTHKMGGVMFWEYDSDLKQYLLDQINKTLR